MIGNSKVGDVWELDMMVPFDMMVPCNTNMSWQRAKDTDTYN